jgi:hypothetical protein
VRRVTDYEGTGIRLTDERLDHIERRPELQAQLDRIEETLQDPDEVRESDQDDTVVLYHRKYPDTPVTDTVVRDCLPPLVCSFHLSAPDSDYCESFRDRPQDDVRSNR